MTWIRGDGGSRALCAIEGEIERSLRRPPERAPERGLYPFSELASASGLGRHPATFGEVCKAAVGKDRVALHFDQRNRRRDLQVVVASVFPSLVEQSAGVAASVFEEKIPVHVTELCHP